MNRFARADLSRMLFLYLDPQNFGGMPKKTLKMMEKCAIASFLCLESNATRTENFHRADGLKNINLFSNSMASGRPRKATKRNISGLRNQKRARSPSPASSQDSQDLCHQSNTPKRHRGINQHAESDSEEDWDPCLAADGDSTKLVGYNGTVAVDDSDAEDTEECDEEWEDSLDDITFCENMIRMSSKCKDDEDWVPYRLQWLMNKRKYKKCTYVLT